MKVKKISRKITILFILITMVGVFIGFNQIKKYNNLLNKVSYNSYDKLSSERKELWNKLKISSAIISKRVTGNSLSNATTSGSSNMNGIDSSATDEYVKTSDVVSYYIELNIDANTKIEGVTDASEFSGGVIKVRATLPKGENGEVYASFETANWMKNTKLTENNTVLYAEYTVPEGTNLVGAIQQLFFTVRIGHNKLENYDGPSFEFWMEGNEPDNETDHVSDINSVKLKDSGLKITSQESMPYIYITPGVINRYDTDENGVYGTYFNFRLYAKSFNAPTNPGYTFQFVNEITSKIKMTYFYKPLNTSNNNWVEVTSDSNNELFNKVFSGTKIVAYNRNGDMNDKAYPNPGSNYVTEQAGFIKNPTTQYGMAMEFDSGNISASIEDNILTVKNSNINNNYMKALKYNTNNSCYTVNYYDDDGYYVPGGADKYSSVCNHIGYYFIDAIEVFVPYYAPDDKSYDFQVKFNLTDDVTAVTENGEVETVKHITNTLVTNASIVNPSGERIYGNISFAGVDDTNLFYGSTKEVRSNFLASDAKHFGEERLINIDGSKFEITSICTTAVCKTLNVKFGIYKSNPTVGLNGIEEQNKAVVDDFYWYDTLDDAKKCTDLVEKGIVGSDEKCIVTSVHILDDAYIGGETAPTYSFNVRPNAESLIKFTGGETLVGAVRQKILLYEDEAHTFEKATKYFYEADYTPAVADDTYYFLQNGAPKQAGASAIFVADYPGMNLAATNSRNERTNYFNVSDERVHYSLSPSINTYVKEKGKVERDSFKIISFYADTYLTFNENSANVKPTSKTKIGNNTYLIWELKNCEVGGVIPGSCDGVDDSLTSISFDFDISPFAPNNTNITIFNRYSSGNSYKGSSLNIGSEKIYFTNAINTTLYLTSLSSSYTRNVTSETNVSPSESFVITNSVYNNSQGILSNVKSVQLLPFNGDSLGSKFNGSYTLKVKSLGENQKLYYTLADEISSGITRDKNDKPTIANVDLAASDKWIEVLVGDTIPSNAKAIATTKDLINAASDSSYSYEIIPSDNKSGNIYAFKDYVSSDNLSSSIVTNTTNVTIYNRKISGFVFEDIDNNKVYNTGDILVSNSRVDLYNDEDKLIDSYYTSTDGTYYFENLVRDDYYIRFNINNDYLYVTKNADETGVSSSVNESGKTDLIYTLGLPGTGEDIIVNNINIGIVKKSEIIKLMIKTESVLEGGTVTGDEIVPYGGDSTPDLIVIKPDSGYVISKITINEEEIDSSFCRDGCTLGRFVNVTEDKNIKVYYASKIVNPETAIMISVKFIIGLIIMFVGIVIFKKIFKNRLKKI